MPARSGLSAVIWLAFWLRLGQGIGFCVEPSLPCGSPVRRRARCLVLGPGIADGAKIRGVMQSAAPQARLQLPVPPPTHPLRRLTW